MTSAQLNVRIDADLKSAGDAVLERFGTSAVQIIRSTWQYMADHQRLPDFVYAFEDHVDEDLSTSETYAAGIALRLAREAGLRAEFESMSFDELRESAYEEAALEEAERNA